MQLIYFLDSFHLQEIPADSFRLRERRAELGGFSYDLSDFAGLTRIDLYFSDSEGRADGDGAFLSVEARCRIDVPNCSIRIAQAALMLRDGRRLAANRITSIAGAANAAAPLLEQCVDGDPLTFCTLLPEQSNGSVRITFAFPEAGAESAPPPEAKARQPKRIAVQPASESLSFAVEELGEAPAYSQSRPIAVGDTDGDGSEELLYIDASGEYLRAAAAVRTGEGVSGLDAASVEQRILSVLPAGTQWEGITALDLDGKQGVELLLLDRSRRIWRWVRSAQSMLLTDAAVSGKESTLLTGDFDGDGREEIAAADREIGSVSVWGLSDEGVFGQEFRVSVQETAAEVPLSAADADGDGRSDLIAVPSPSRIQLYLARRSRMQHSLWRYITDMKQRPEVLLAGNLDGLHGEELLLSSPLAPGAIHLLRSGGAGYEETAVVWAVLHPQFDFTHKLRGDFDGNGAPDLALRAAAGRYWQFILSAGDRGRMYSGLPEFNPSAGWSPVLAADVDGDGRDEVLAYHQPSARWWLARSSSEKGRAANETPSEMPAGHSPKVCIGFNPGTIEGWGGFFGESAPPHFAVYASTEGGGSNAPAALGMFYCPLPGEDILLGEAAFVERRCPEGMVVTGGDVRYFKEKTRYYLRCSRINTERYRLGPALPGRYWGIGFSGVLSGARLPKKELPAAIRYGVGREDFLPAYHKDGCIGVPFGSLLVQVGEDSCEDMRYRQLLFRGAPGDPPDGTPVLMFPNCDDVDDVFSSEPKCIPEGESVR